MRFANLRELYTDSGWKSSLNVAKCLYDFGLCPLPLDPAADGRLKACKTPGWPTASKASMMAAIESRIASGTPTGIGCRVESSIWFLDFDAPGKVIANVPALMADLRAKTALGLTDDDLAAFRAAIQLNGRGGFILPVQSHPALRPLFEATGDGRPRAKVTKSLPCGGALEFFGGNSDGIGSQVAIWSDPFTKRPVGGPDLFKFSNDLAARFLKFFGKAEAEPGGKTEGRWERPRQSPDAVAALPVAERDSRYDWAAYDRYIDNRLRGVLRHMTGRLSRLRSGRHDATFHASLAMFGHLNYYNRPDLHETAYEALVRAYVAAGASEYEAGRTVADAANVAASKGPLPLDGDEGPRLLTTRPAGILTGGHAINNR